MLNHLRMPFFIAGVTSAIATSLIPLAAHFGLVYLVLLRLLQVEFLEIHDSSNGSKSRETFTLALIELIRSKKMSSISFFSLS